MIGKNLDWEGGAVEVVTPCFESANNSEEFAIINVIVLFCWRERLGEIGARMPVSINISL